MMSGELKENNTKILKFISFAVIITIFIAVPIYSPKYGSKEIKWIYDTGEHVYDIEIASDGSYYVVGTRTSILLFHKSTPVPIWKYSPLNHIYPVSISSDGKYFAGTDWDKLYLFTREGNTIGNSFILNESYVIGWHSIDISLNGKYFVATHYKTLYLFSTTNFLPIWNFTAEEILWNAQISADGSFIAAMDHNRIYIFSKLFNSPIWTYPINPMPYRIALSTDGQYLITSSRNTLYFFHTENPIPIWTIDLSDTVYTFTISLDGSYIVAGSVDGNLYLFTKESPIPIWIYKTPYSVNSVSISADNTNIAVASAFSPICPLCVGCPCPPDQGIMYFFNKDSSNPVSMRNMGGYIYSCAITPDGGSVLVGCADNKIYCF